MAASVNKKSGEEYHHLYQSEELNQGEKEGPSLNGQHTHEQIKPLDLEATTQILNQKEALLEENKVTRESLSSRRWNPLQYGWAQFTSWFIQFYSSLTRIETEYNKVRERHLTIRADLLKKEEEHEEEEFQRFIKRRREKKEQERALEKKQEDHLSEIRNEVLHLEQKRQSLKNQEDKKREWSQS